jgi:hypothetical protein
MKNIKKSDAEIIADSILRELNTSAHGIIDLDEVPEFSKYKKSLPMHKYGWLRKWDKDFSSQLMKEAHNRNICFETGKTMGNKEARGFSLVIDDKIDRIFVIATKC